MDTTRNKCSRPIALEDDIKYKDNGCTDQTGSLVDLTSMLTATWTKEVQMETCERYCFDYHEGLSFRFAKTSVNSDTAHDCACFTSRCDNFSSIND